ncbi:MAG: hypothetical protein IJK67_04020 [Bacilli bacterium]|nr:hypothetical protein [Bacilli bacterium]
MNTVEQHINAGELPSFDFLSKEDYETIFGQVKIPYNGDIKDQQLSAEALERLKFNAKINKALMTQKAQNVNKDLLSKYDDLILEESELIESAREKYDGAIPEMNEVVNELKNEKSMHERTVNNFTFSNVNEMLNDIQKVRINDINTKMEKNDNKLQAKYNKLTEYNETMQNARTNFKKRRTARRIARVVKRIEKLREKQGKLIGRQRYIINNALARYVEIKNKQMKEYGKTIASDRKYINKIEDLNNRLEAARYDKRMTENEINGLNDDVKGKFNKISLQMDKNKLESQINSLNRKIARAQQMREFHQKLKMLRGKGGIQNGFSVLGVPFEEQQTEQVSFGR